MPALNRTLEAQLTIRFVKPSSRPTKNGCSAMMRSRVSILASFPNSPDILGDVDTHRAPGYATTAANTSRTAELVDPGGQLVSHPLAIACFGGGSDTASVNIGKALCEAGIPAAPAFGVISGNASYIFHRGAVACGADHRAVGTRQATAGHVVPARMLKVLVEKLLDASGIDAAHLLARRRFHPRPGFLAVCCGSWNRFQLSEYLGAAIATRVYQEAVPLGPQEFCENKVKAI